MNFITMIFNFILLVIGIILISLFTFGGCYFIYQLAKNVCKTFKKVWEEEKNE